MTLTNGIELTNEEFFFLAGMMGTNTLIGVPDPYIGYLTEEIEQEMRNSVQSLIKKGYITLREEDIEIASELLHYVRICANATMTFWLHGTRNGLKEERYYYFSSRKVIESKVIESETHVSYILEERGVPAQAWFHVLRFMQPNDTPAISDKTITLSADFFMELIEKNENYTVENMETLLLAKKVPLKIAKPLAEAVKQHNFYGRFTGHYHVQHDWRIHGLQILSNDDTSWLIKNVTKRDEDYVQIRSITLAEFMEEMKSIIDSLKKPNLYFV